MRIADFVVFLFIWQESPIWEDPFSGKVKLFSQKSLYPTSTVFKYSNPAMLFLGEIVSEKSGMAYEKYVIEHI